MANKIEITKAPGNVTNLTLTRTKGTRTLVAKWKVPSARTQDSDHRAEQVKARWTYVRTGKDATKDWGPSNIQTTERSLSISRAQYYPHKGKPKLTAVKCTVKLHNRKGDSSGSTAAFKFTKPGKPTVAAIEQDEDTGRCTCKITAYDGSAGHRERYDTRYHLRVYDSRHKGKASKGWLVDKYETFTGDSHTVPYDVKDRYQLDYDQYVCVSVEACSRGLAGDSAWTSLKRLYVSYPTKVTISSVKTPSKDPKAKVTVNIQTGKRVEKASKKGYTYEADPRHPVTGVRLQVLRSTSAKTASQATALGDDWKDTEVVDNGQCTALSVGVADVVPDAGTRTWVRVKSWNQFEGKFYRYSDPVELKALRTALPTASDDKCGIVYTSPSKDGTGCFVAVGVSENSRNTGVEVQWADHANAWTSTEGPETATFSGTGSSTSGMVSLGGSVVAAKEAVANGWKKATYFSISGLTPGKTYWARVRLYLESEEGDTTYSALSKAVSFATASAANDTCGIVSAVAADGGTSAVVQVGWTEDSTNTGTEVSWSTDESAWLSTAQPESFQFTWKDSTSASADWGDTATVYVRGLEPNRDYYIRARRYLDSADSSNESASHTPWSATAKVSTVVDDSASDSIAIISATPQQDGKSVLLAIGWTEESANTGTEVGWSADENAWASTDQPQTFQFDWKDQESRAAELYAAGNAAAHDADGSPWKSTAAVIVAGLEEGTLCHFRARRYLNSETVAYTAWSPMVSATPSSSPSSVTLSLPEFVARGSGCEATWTFDSDAEQRSWELVTGTVVTTTETLVGLTDVTDSTSAETTTRTYGTLASEGRVVVARGSDSHGSAAISPDRLAGLVGEGSSLALAVRVSTGGDYVESEVATVTIADPPTLAVTAPSTLTAQPLSLSLSCDVAASVTVVVGANGAVGEGPEGGRTQTDGDTVWSDALVPAWEEGEDAAYEASLTLPSGLDLWDLARYTVVATATDDVTGLSSTASIAEFDVAWAHQAPTPGDVTVTPVDETDLDGARSIRCELSLPSGGMGEGDVYDVYRVTPDGPYLIAEGAKPGSDVTDPYAPYGWVDAFYRVACRTADGDVDWKDFPYHLPGVGLRIDFGDRYAELPFNATWSDSYQKDFEARSHVGEPRPQGYWSEGFTRKASLSTDLIKIRDSATACAVRKLAERPGPCFVRTSDGCAYQASVDVGIAYRYSDCAVAVTIDATEVALTDEFRAPTAADEEDDA